MVGDVLSWGAVALGIYVLASGSALALFALLTRIRRSRSVRSSRGELAEAPYRESIPDLDEDERSELELTFRSIVTPEEVEP